MTKKLKRKVGRIWLISDTHFNHAEKMIEYCDRSSVYEEVLIQSFISMIPPQDTLIHLGDFCVGKDEEMHQKYLAPIYGKTVLIRGNHDRKSVSWYLAHGWSAVFDRVGIECFGKKILFSHVPVKDDGWYDLNIHGHFHNSKFRYHEPELMAVKNRKHRLFCLEKIGYRPILLQTFIQKEYGKNQNKILDKAKATIRKPSLARKKI